MKIALVTGSNRGIGREVCRQLLQLGWTVVGTSRNGQTDLDHPSFHVIQGDVSNDASVMAMRHQFPFDHLDLLINNAGIIGSGHGVSGSTMDEITEIMNTNALGPLRMARAFEDVLVRSAQTRIVNVSSGMGVFDELSTGYFAYRWSKNQLNALTLRMHAEHFAKACVVSVCPGWVKTDMGGASAPRSVEQGGRSVVLAAVADHIQSGKFYRDGNEIPW